MKVLDLACVAGHAFEGWFGSEEDFQSQHARGLVQCPVCGMAEISKKLSAPRLNLRSTTRDLAVPTQRRAAPAAAAQNNSAQVPMSPEAAWLALARKVVAETEDVGASFAEEARKMKQGDAPERAIRGQTSVREAVALMEEGIPVLPLPIDDAFKNPLQ